MSDRADGAVAEPEVTVENAYLPPVEGWRKPIPDPAPQDGPQTAFQACDADIAVIGGGAFGGKSFVLLLEALRHVEDPEFRAVCFRREMPQLRMAGGLWDEAWSLYTPRGARLVESPDLEVQWPSGSSIVFAHLQLTKTMYNWDSSQIPLLMFDQLESFEEEQFWYLFGRNRDKSGHIRPYCRAACNPMPDSWLGRLLGWWIDMRPTLVVDGVDVPNPGFGFAIPERSGVVRWMVRAGNEMIWGETREEAVALARDPDLPDDHEDQPDPISVTFILARIKDNRIGLARNPGYKSKLKALVKHERERLLGDEERGGNWNARPTAGNYFQRTWCNVLPMEPWNVDWVRGWDLAATRVSTEAPNPDWTVGVKLGRYRGSRRFVIAADVQRLRESPAKVADRIDKTAGADGPEVKVRIPQDPGQAGKSQAADLIALLAGYDVRATPQTGDKETRFTPFSRQAEAGNVDYVAGIPEEYLRCLEQFPPVKSGHDDDVDATSEAFHELAKGLKGEEILAYFERVGGGVKVEETGMKRQTPMPGIADAVRIARGDGLLSAAPNAGPVSMRVKAPEAHQNFTRSAPDGRACYYAADAEGIIVDHREVGGPIKAGDPESRIVANTEEDVVHLVKAGCVRLQA